LSRSARRFRIPASRRPARRDGILRDEERRDAEKERAFLPGDRRQHGRVPPARHHDHQGIAQLHGRGIRELTMKKLVVGSREWGVKTATFYSLLLTTYSLLFCAAAGCSSNKSATTRPASTYDRQQAALKDPFGY